MSADLDIHILKGVTPEEYRLSQANCIFSKHFDFSLCRDDKDINDAVDKIRKTPRITAGELDSGPNDFEEVLQYLIGEDLQLITDELIQQIMEVCDEFRGGSREFRHRLRRFLKRHRGKPVFTMVW